MVHIRRIALEPVHGLWEDSEQIVRDDLNIYEIMVEKLQGGADTKLRAREPLETTIPRCESPPDSLTVSTMAVACVPATT